MFRDTSCVEGVNAGRLHVWDAWYRCIVADGVLFENGFVTTRWRRSLVAGLASLYVRLETLFEFLFKTGVFWFVETNIM